MSLIVAGSRSEDAPFIALEKRLIVAYAMRREPPALDLDWRVAAASLATQFPERWSLPDPPGGSP